MLRSMTGFASTTITLVTEKTKSNVTISLKSLNSRFFESTCKIPYQLSTLEVDIIKNLKTLLYRGHIYLMVYVTNPEIFTGSISPALTTIGGYIKAIDELKKVYPIQGNLTIDALLQLPDLFVVEEKNLTKDIEQGVLQAVQQLAQTLITTQEREGSALHKDIEKQIASMKKNVEHIAEQSVAIIAKQKEKVTKALQDITLQQHNLVDIQKHAAYVLLDKMDINEEIVRFKSHLHNLTETLNSPDIEKGKRIDFTIQEMAREINTIAAKCSDATISSLAISIKVELEKAREQVQNIV